MGKKFRKIIPHCLFCIILAFPGGAFANTESINTSNTPVSKTGEQQDLSMTEQTSSGPIDTEKTTAEMSVEIEPNVPPPQDDSLSPNSENTPVQPVIQEQENTAFSESNNVLPESENLGQTLEQTDAPPLQQPVVVPNENIAAVTNENASVALQTSSEAGLPPANDLGSSGPPSSLSLMSASTETIVDNGDGSFTYTQRIDENSTSPNYTPPENGGGFGIYSWFNQDFGWQHNFSHWNISGLTIESATMKISAYDIDSEVSWGLDGEYDGVSVDGILLNPGYLQGTNGTWSETTFNIPTDTIFDDGNINVFVNIDMNHDYENWATTLDYSELKITYRQDGNHAPFKPLLTKLPMDIVGDNDDLMVNVTGPDPRDPDGDTVTYKYRWLVDVGTGSFVDDEFAGRGDHIGNTVLASDTILGDIWRVEVIPVDEHGAIGPLNTIDFAPISASNRPSISVEQHSVIVDEGQTATNSGHYSDPESNDNVTILSSVGTVSKTGTNEGTWKWSFIAKDGTAQTQNVEITADDGLLQSLTSFNLTVNNVAPKIISVTVPNNLVAVNTDVNVKGNFIDPGILDTHTAEWDWGDDSKIAGIVTEKDGSGTVIGTHRYSKPGIYIITLRVTDNDGGTVFFKSGSLTIVDTKLPKNLIVNEIRNTDTQITGTGEPGATVFAMVDDNKIGEATIDNSGAFTIVIPNQVVGTIINIYVKDAVGNVSEGVSITVKGGVSTSAITRTMFNSFEPSNDNELPDTATNYFNLLFTGVALLSVGVVTLIVRKMRQITK